MTTIVETFTTAQTINWMAPMGVTSVQVELWGGGGHGGGDNSDFHLHGGGGGGAYAKSTVSVTPGYNYTIVVGQLGNGGQTATNSTWQTNIVVAACGENGQISSAGAAGGSVANSIGTVRYAGGNGGAAYTGGYSKIQAGGGGGGSSAGPNSNGNNGGDGGSTTEGVGGAAVSGGGAGGNGGKNYNNGHPGSAPGGAGGGSSLSCDGGPGAAGQAKLTYEYTYVPIPPRITTIIPGKEYIRLKGFI